LLEQQAKVLVRVLWFVNITPASISRETGGGSQHYGGWIDSLLELVKERPEIELGVALPGKGKARKFVKDNVSYYPLLDHAATSKIGRVAARLFHKIGAPQQVNDYVDVVNDFQPALVHIFGTELAYGLVAPRVNVPVVIQLQGNLTEYLKTMFVGLSFAKQLRFGSKPDLILGRGHIHAYYTMKKSAAREREIFSSCHYVIGRTDWDKRVSRALAPKSRYYYCSEPLRREIFLKTWQPPKNERPVLVTIMRDSSYKGLECLIGAFFFVKQKVPDVRLKVIGTTLDEPYSKMMQKVFPALRFEEAIEFFGVLPPGQIAEELASCNCYVHPSHIENSPNSICEAMVMGVPIVSTNVGGIPSILEDRKEGILVAPGQPRAMADAVLELFNNPELCSMFSRNARATAMQRHDPERIVGNLLKIYTDITDLELS
jgi:glycosyltransferase involved in cell wall biosynthesis